MGATAQLAAAAVCGTVRERGGGGFWVTVDSIGAICCVDQLRFCWSDCARVYLVNVLLRPSADPRLPPEHHPLLSLSSVKAKEPPLFGTMDESELYDDYAFEPGDDELDRDIMDDEEGGCNSHFNNSAKRCKAERRADARGERTCRRSGAGVRTNSQVEDGAG